MIAKMLDREFSESAWSDEGSVEAGLAVIPTTAFFLLILQLVVAGSMKTIETMNLQSWLNKSALYAVDGEISNQINSSSMPGGGELLTFREDAVLPSISSFAKPLAARNELRISSQAIAVRD